MLEPEEKSYYSTLAYVTDEVGVKLTKEQRDANRCIYRDNPFIDDSTHHSDLHRAVQWLISLRLCL